MRTALLSAVVLVSSLGFAASQEQPPAPRISTSGTSLVTVAPDSVRLVFELGGQGDTQQQASQALADKEAALRQALAGLAIERLRVESRPAEVIKAPTGGQGGGGFGGYGGTYGGGGYGGRLEPRPGEAKPYWAWQTVVATLTGVSGQELAGYADRIRQAAPDDDTNRLDEMTFFVSSPVREDAERKALQQAVKSAVANAQAIADAAGVTIRGYQEISGTPTAYYYGEGSAGGAAGPAWMREVDPSAKGTLVVMCTVTLTAGY